MSERNDGVRPLAHGAGVRGLTGVSGPGDIGGRFSRIFPESLEMEEISDRALAQLALRMQADPERPEDREDPEEGHIPAAYTYFGQFVDHDLTFDPSTFQEQRRDPSGTLDYRTPRFDLDCVYGRGPQDQPYLYDGDHFTLGEPLEPIARNRHPTDLPRAAPNAEGVRRAIIGDPRNDENVIVSQLHGLFLRFHNGMVDRHPGEPFVAIQRRVRWHYQWIVLHHFLPLLVSPEILDSISPAIIDTSKSLVDKPPRRVLTIKSDTFGQPTMPVEFSVAAYRLGHSMVRASYRFNETGGPQSIFRVIRVGKGPARQRAGERRFNTFDTVREGNTIDWQRFIDLGRGPRARADEDRVQMAYKIDTSLVDPLAHLPAPIAGPEATDDRRLHSLAFRNLLRGRKLLLPSGQQVAKRMGVPYLLDEQIFIGKAETPARGRPSETAGATVISDIPELQGRCPLWPYILAESRRNFFHGRRKAVLGPVGGRIVAEVIVELLANDPSSFLAAEPNWRPDGGDFRLEDLIRSGLDYGEPRAAAPKRRDPLIRNKSPSKRGGAMKR